MARFVATRRDEPGVQLLLAARAVVGARRSPTSSARTLEQLAEVDAAPTWVLSNHDVVRHATRYGGGAGRPRPRPGGHARDAGAARARRTSTRARSSASRRSTSPGGAAPGPRSGCAPGATGATAAGCRSRGPATRRRTASGPGPASPGCRSRSTGPTAHGGRPGGGPGLDAGVLPGRAGRPPQARGRRRRGRRAARRSAPTCWPSGGAGLTVVLNAGTDAVELPGGRRAWSRARSSTAGCCRPTPRSGWPSQPVAQASERAVVALEPGRRTSSSSSVAPVAELLVEPLAAVRGDVGEPAHGVLARRRRAWPGRRRGPGVRSTRPRSSRCWSWRLTAPLSMPNCSTIDEARTGPSSTSQESMRYDAGWRSSWTARARSPMTRLIRRISTPTSRSRWRSESRAARHRTPASTLLIVPRTGPLLPIAASLVVERRAQRHLADEQDADQGDQGERRRDQEQVAGRLAERALVERADRRRQRGQVRDRAAAVAAVDADARRAPR